MSNRGDMPAMPFEGGDNNREQPYTGMTIRERYCLEMGVPLTGDSELDSIICEGNRIKDARAAIQGLLASGPHDCDEHELAHDAAINADALLAELERTGGGHE